MISHYISSGIKYLTDRRYRILFNANRGRYDNLTDEQFLSKMFKINLGYELNLDNPSTFNEKLQWLKLYDRDPKYTELVDKYRVREFVSSAIGKNYLIPLLGVWEKVEDINFDQLPKRFVLKCNHNSGLGMIICKDKSLLNISEAKKELKKGLSEDYYMRYREWPYKNVPRRIIAEQYMEDYGEKNLIDYKIHCFNGEPKFILVCSDRFSQDGIKEDFYDLDWNLMDVHRPDIPNSKDGIKCPDKLEEMLNLAKVLSKNLKFARIDFYIIKGQVYFGEITFFPGSGMKKFVPESADYVFGQWLDLCNKS